MPRILEVIADTGAADHLVPRHIADQFHDYVTELQEAIQYFTASGTETGTHELNLVWRQLGEAGAAVVLPDTPSVISVGRWVIDKGWHFEWPPEFAYSPFFIKPDGTIVWLVVRNYVPFLRDTLDHMTTYGRREANDMLAAARRRHTRKEPPRPEDADAPRLSDDIPDVCIDDDGNVLPPPEVDENAPLHERRRSRARRDLWTEAHSVRHMCTHMPANPYCNECRFGKGLR